MASHQSEDELDEVCFGAENDLWYLDSGCSRHMTGDKSKFSFILPKDGFVTYGDNNNGKILGIGRIGKPPHVIIDNVLYVDGLKQNILSMRSTM
ncbi:hypothetical protein Lal_00021370 [Lupinus albus]|nr:hypothetical protein Lal_00021370 [Lupinus albus]